MLSETRLSDDDRDLEGLPAPIRAIPYLCKYVSTKSRRKSNWVICLVGFFVQSPTVVHWSFQ